jgi:uncharacterized protein (TIGR02646 family)
LRHVSFNPARCDDWSAEQAKSWKDWAAKASKAEIAFHSYSPGNPPEPKSEIWAELKRWLLDYVFSGKCAYCEIKIKGGFFGEGEHYRPKKRVSVRKNGKLCVVETIPPNDGYFWLMYDWQNLIPSCQECNNLKVDQFPAKNHVLYPSPTADQLDAIEQPRLLHPYRDNPSDHIRFGKFGIVAAVDGSEMGRETIEVLGLDRDTLTERRREKQEQAHTALKLALVQYMTSGMPLTENVDLQNYMLKSAEFSIGVRDFVEQAKAEYASKFSKIEAVRADERSA